MHTAAKHVLRHRAPRRLDDDERLDTILDQLQRKVPGVQQPAAAAARRVAQQQRAASAGGRARGGGRSGDCGGYDEWGGELEAGCSEGGCDEDDTSEATTVGGQLAAEMRAVRRQLEALGGRAVAKARRAGAVPAGPEYGRSPRRPGA